jgi:hypothetical protein
MTEIQECSVKDLPELSHLWEKMILEVMENATPSRELWIKHIEAYMKHEDFKAYKAIVDGETVGYVSGMLFLDPATARIVALGLEFYVLPEYRGEIGKSLYLKLVKEGKRRGAVEVRLICYENTLEKWKNSNMNVRSYIIGKVL